MDPEIVPAYETQPVMSPVRIGVGPRFGAAILDLIITLLGGLVLGGLFGAALGSLFLSISAIQLGGILGASLGMVAGMIVFGFVNLLLEAFYGATVGKMIVGIKIGSADGTKATAPQLWKRWLIKNISAVGMMIAAITHVNLISTVSSILGLVVLIGFFFIFGSKHQGFHDMLAHTAVYRKKELV